MQILHLLRSLFTRSFFTIFFIFEIVLFVFQAMHAVEPDMLINFLPVILNQLFRILPTPAMDEVQLNVVR